MAKDDYHVIVYQILAYLYVQLKKGEDVDGVKISVNSDLYSINKKYWEYVILNLSNEQYVRGITVIRTDTGYIISNLDDAEITPKGIEYLTDKSFLKKAYKFAKNINDLIPFV